MRIMPRTEALTQRIEKDNALKRRFIQTSRGRLAPVLPAVPEADWHTGVYDNSVGVTLEDEGAKFTVFNWGKPLAWAFVSKMDLRRLRDRLNSLDLD